jgi:diguanylate cyclase (GGDEF)-like protein
MRTPAVPMRAVTSNRFVSDAVRRPARLPLFERPLVDRVSFLAWRFLPFAFLWFFAFGVFVARPEMVPYFNAEGMPIALGFLGLQCVVTMALIVAAAWVRSRAGRGEGALVLVTCLWFALATVVIFFAVGSLTTSFSMFAVAMPLIGLLLFGRRPVMQAIGIVTVPYTPIAVLKFIGVLPYAPLLMRSPLEDGRIPLTWVLFNGAPWFALTVVSIGGFIYMQLQLEARERQLAELAETDALTGLYNRRRVTHVLAQLLTARDRDSVAVVIFDADHFKRVNDDHGHAVGDDVLRIAAESLRQVCPASGTVARIGGEEFIVIATPPRRIEPDVWSDELRRASQHETQTRLHRAGLQAIHFTWSAGATALLESDSVESVLHRADMALLHAKTGRDCLVWADPVASFEDPLDDAEDEGSGTLPTVDTP